MIKFAIAILNLIYAPFKLFPCRDKVTFISRQSNKPSQDGDMLRNKLYEINPETEVVMLYRKLDNKLSYCFHIILQMYHIATSKVVILDSYCIAISVLKHKKSLKVIQMWHALGALKRFGFSILDEEEGSNGHLAALMKMHHGYDYVITSSGECMKHFQEAFGYSEAAMRVFSLPRVDLLKEDKHQRNIKKEILKKYPQLADKPNIVYAPTFRKDTELHSSNAAAWEFVEAVDLNTYNLVIKVHPLTEIEIPKEGVLVDYTFSSLDMFSVADYIVLDYSAAIYEAALLSKPLFFYAFDLEEYKSRRNFYIDYEKEMPGVISVTGEGIAKAIEDNQFDLQRVNDFADKYVTKQENCTLELAQFVIDCMGKTI